MLRFDDEHSDRFESGECCVRSRQGELLLVHLRKLLLDQITGDCKGHAIWPLWNRLRTLLSNLTTYLGTGTLHRGLTLTAFESHVPR